MPTVQALFQRATSNTSGFTTAQNVEGSFLSFDTLNDAIAFTSGALANTGIHPDGVVTNSTPKGGASFFYSGQLVFISSSKEFYISKFFDAESLGVGTPENASASLHPLEFSVNLINTSSLVSSIQTGSFIINEDTGSFVQNSVTASLLVRNTETGSFITNNDTGSFTLNSVTASLLVRNTETGSFVVNSQTSSFAVTASDVVFNSVSSSKLISGDSLIISSSNDLSLYSVDQTIIKAKNNTTPITINHPMSRVDNVRAAVTYKNDERNVLHYHSEKYLLSQSNQLGVYKGVGMATISASIGSSFAQTVADFASSFVAVHMNYNAVGAQGGYVETGEFHIAYNQSGNSYNHQPKVLLAKNTSQTILNLTSSGGFCKVDAQINSSFGPVEIMYEYTAFTQGII